MEPYFMSKEKLESKIKDTKNNIILLNNNIKTPACLYTVTKNDRKVKIGRAHV